MYRSYITRKHQGNLKKCPLQESGHFWSFYCICMLENIGLIANTVFTFQDESSVNLFAGGEQEISSTDPDLLKWIQKRIENLMKYKQR